MLLFSLTHRLPSLAACLWLCLLAVLAGPLLPAVRGAASVSTLLSFPTTIQGAASGLTPGGDGYLYGTAYGTNSIYKVKLDGSGFQILYTFSAPNGQGINADGYGPARELVAPGDGYLYGLTTYGGTNGSGTVYRISLTGAFLAIYSFSAKNSQFQNADGANPASGLATNGDGYLYGTANAGGPNAEGTVFRLRTDGSGFQTIHPFTFGNPADGSNVYAPLTWGGDGYFYGTTVSGGANYFGTIYRIKPDGTGFLLLHSFTSAEGGSFSAVTLGTDGRFYGVSFQGGANQTGLLWGINPDGTGFTPIHVFSAENAQSIYPDGYDPYGALAVDADGTLYGTAENGGTGGHGTVFQVSPDGTGFTVLAPFGVNASDPNDPVGSLTRIGSTIYGTTSYGGPIGFGTIFQISGVAASQPPAAPLNLSAALISGGSGAALAWQLGDASDTSVVVERQIGMGAFAVLAALPAGTVSYNASNLAASTTYTYRIRAVSAAGSSTPSNTATVTTPPAVEHLLWTTTGGVASLWNYNATAGTYTYHNFGPLSGYTAKTLADGPADGGTDGQTRLLWTAASGAALIWSLNSAAGTYTSHGFGPFPTYTAKALSVGTDNTTHILWTSTNGTASLWNYSTSAGTYTYHNYGPFPGYTAQAIADGVDGKMRVLWTTTSGIASIWSLDNGTGTYSYHNFGPFAGYTPVGFSVGTDNTTHLLWTTPSGVASIWNYNTTSGAYSYHNFGPFSGYGAKGIADSSDGSLGVLWTTGSGIASLWSLDNVAGTYSYHNFGPFAGYTPVALSGAG